MQLFLLPPDQVQTGPHSLDELRAMWISGQLTLNYRYWHEGMADWQTIQELEPLLRRLQVPAQAVPVTVPAPWTSAPSILPPLPETTGSLPPLPTSSALRLTPAAAAPTIVGGDDLSGYYRREFTRIHESGETYGGAWNWAAFFLVITYLAHNCVTLRKLTFDSFRTHDAYSKLLTSY